MRRWERPTLGGRMGDDVGKKEERRRETKAAQEKKGWR
jgi:hypothetical protein